MKDVVLAIFATIGGITAIVGLAIAIEQVYLWKANVDFRLEHLEQKKEPITEEDNE